MELSSHPMVSNPAWHLKKHLINSQMELCSKPDRRTRRSMLVSVKKLITNQINCSSTKLTMEMLSSKATLRNKLIKLAQSELLSRFKQTTTEISFSLWMELTSNTTVIRSRATLMNFIWKYCSKKKNVSLKSMQNQIENLKRLSLNCKAKLKAWNKKSLKKMSRSLDMMQPFKRLKNKASKTLMNSNKKTMKDNWKKRRSMSKNWKSLRSSMITNSKKKMINMSIWKTSLPRISKRKTIKWKLLKQRMPKSLRLKTKKSMIWKHKSENSWINKNKKMIKLWRHSLSSREVLLETEANN